MSKPRQKRAMKVTSTNLYTLADALRAGGGVVSKRVPASDMPHLRRTLMAGLIVERPDGFVATPAGIAALEAALSEMPHETTMKETYRQAVALARSGATTAAPALGNPPPPGQRRRQSSFQNLPPAISVRWLAPNQAYAVMWHDQVLRVLHTADDVEDYLKDLRRPDVGEELGYTERAHGTARDYSLARLRRLGPEPGKLRGRGGKLHVERIRLNRGGYDSRGRYYGVGAPLFHVTGEGSFADVDEHVRAKSAKEARNLVGHALQRIAGTTRSLRTELEHPRSAPFVTTTGEGNPHASGNPPPPGETSIPWVTSAHERGLRFVDQGAVWFLRADAGTLEVKGRPTTFDHYVGTIHKQTGEIEASRGGPSGQRLPAATARRLLRQARKELVRLGHVTMHRGAELGNPPPPPGTGHEGTYVYGPATIKMSGGGRSGWFATVRFRQQEIDLGGRTFDEAAERATRWVDDAPELAGRPFSGKGQGLTKAGRGHAARSGPDRLDARDVAGAAREGRTE